MRWEGGVLHFFCQETERRADEHAIENADERFIRQLECDCDVAIAALKEMCALACEKQTCLPSFKMVIYK